MDISQLQLLAQRTEAAADIQDTIDGYRRLIIQMEKFLQRAYGNHRRLLDGARDKLVAKPSIDELKAFLQSKRQIKSDIQVATLQKFRSALNKFISVKSDGRVEKYTEAELESLKRFVCLFNCLCFCLFCLLWFCLLCSYVQFDCGVGGLIENNE